MARLAVAALAKGRTIACDTIFHEILKHFDPPEDMNFIHYLRLNQKV